MSDLTIATRAGYFADEASAWEQVEASRWPDGPGCPQCGMSADAYLLQAKTGTRTTSTGKVSYRHKGQTTEEPDEAKVSRPVL